MVAAIGRAMDNAWVDNCVNLTKVSLDEGDLSLFAQPREVIEAYYQGQTQIKECKVIFLGDGGAGKTALIKRITNGTFTPGTPPTDGIETTKKKGLVRKWVGDGLVVLENS